jgi:hypothetical protein
MQEIAGDTNVVACWHDPLETFSKGPPDDVLRKTRYPPPGGRPDDVTQLRERLVDVASAAVPAPGAFSVIACACPVPSPETVV